MQTDRWPRDDASPPDGVRSTQRRWVRAAAVLVGLVRHVVRTQSDGPAPDPDVEGWLRAGRPSHDRELGDAYEAMACVRAVLDPDASSDHPEGGEDR